jgi:uncharacterized membrane protein
MASKKPKTHLPANSSQNKSIITHQQVSYYQGPFPSPETLRQFEQLVPGSAEKLFNMFESQAMHRMSLEKSVISSDIRDGNLGLWFGFIVAMTAVNAAKNEKAKPNHQAKTPSSLENG